MEALTIRQKIEAGRSIVMQRSIELGFPYERIVGKRRFRKLCKARHQIMNELRKLGFSCPEIGMLFDRDHSSVVQVTSPYKAILKRRKEERAKRPRETSVEVGVLAIN